MELGIGESIIRLILSFILGGIIGLEREKNKRPAGFRTHIIVAMSSCLAMLISYHLFNDVVGTTNMDPGRMGSYVISGIGFLGAGTIIREGASVKGLTTAASLWASAMLGLAVGSGLYEISLIVTALILLALLTMNKIEHRYVSKYQELGDYKVENSDDEFYKSFNRLLKNNKIKFYVKKSESDIDEDETYEIVEIKSNDEEKE